MYVDAKERNFGNDWTNEDTAAKGKRVKNNTSSKTRERRNKERLNRQWMDEAQDTRKGLDLKRQWTKAHLPLRAISPQEELRLRQGTLVSHLRI